MTQYWTVNSLAEALATADKVAQGAMTVEVVEGATPGLHVLMHDFGDLPIFGSVDGEQMVFKVSLWPVSAVKDGNAFNDMALKMHKLLPLSTFGIITEDDGMDYYELFGALSSQSRIEAVLQELDTLADNTVNVTEWAQEQQLLTDA